MREKNNSPRNQNEFDAVMYEVANDVDQFANGIAIDNIAGSDTNKVELILGMEDLYGRYDQVSGIKETLRVREAIESRVASQITNLLLVELDEGRISPTLVESIRDVPLSLESLQPHLDELFAESIRANEAYLFSQNSEEIDYVVNFSKLTGNYALHSTTRDGKTDGKQFKVEQIRDHLNSIKRTRAQQAKAEQTAALNSFTRSAYALPVEVFEPKPSQLSTALGRAAEVNKSALAKGVAAAAILTVGGAALSPAAASAAPSESTMTYPPSPNELSVATNLDFVPIEKDIAAAQIKEAMTEANVEVKSDQQSIDLTTTSLKPGEAQKDNEAELTTIVENDMPEVVAKAKTRKPQINSDNTRSSEKNTSTNNATENANNDRDADVTKGSSSADSVMQVNEDEEVADIIATPRERKPSVEEDDTSDETPEIIASPRPRADREPPVVQEDEEGNPIVIAIPHPPREGQRPRAFIEEPAPAPAPEPAPAPAPETAPAPEAAPQLPMELQAAHNLIARGGETPNYRTSWENTGRGLVYFMEKGLTNSQAIGVMANAMQESAGVVPSKNQSGGPAFGIFQWEAGRQDSLRQYAASQGRDVNDLYVQLDFAWMELETQAWNGLAELKNAKTSHDATVIFMNKFERPGVPHLDKRLAAADNIKAAYNDEAGKIIAAAEAERRAQENADLALHAAPNMTGWPTTGQEAMELFNQCDPRWGEIRTPNGNRACNVACGPTSVAMLVNMFKPDSPITPQDTISAANDEKLWFGIQDSGGVTFDAAIRLGDKFGIKGAQLSAGQVKDYNTYKSILERGGAIMVAGSGPVPFVMPDQGAHFVIIRGMTPDGKFLVADPAPKTRETNTVAFDPNQILNSAFGAIEFHG